MKVEKKKKTILHTPPRINLAKYFSLVELHEIDPTFSCLPVKIVDGKSPEKYTFEREDPRMVSPLCMEP